jgi:hypothetical protein
MVISCRPGGRSDRSPRLPKDAGDRAIPTPGAMNAQACPEDVTGAALRDPLNSRPQGRWEVDRWNRIRPLEAFGDLFADAEPALAAPASNARARAPAGAARLSAGAALWTRDKRLHAAVAEPLELAMPELDGR